MNSTERVFSEKLKNLIAESRSIVVAFSGGCDSLALLVLCSKIPGLKVTPVYVDHNIRSRSELDQELALNVENCRRLGLELVVRTLEPGLVQEISQSRGGGIEDAARVLRYQELQTVRMETGSDWILTAHHLQDRLETLLMRLQSGAPFTSLRGIVTRDSQRKLVRPLLDFARKDLESYLTDYGFSWSTDSTNADTAYERNRIRNVVIPELERSWPEYRKVLLGLEEDAGLAYRKTVKVEDDSLSLEVFKDLDVCSRMTILYDLWDKVFRTSDSVDKQTRDFPMSYVSRVLEAISEGVDCTVGSNGAIFTIYHGRLYLSDPSTDAEFQSYECEIDPFSDNQVILPGGLRLSFGVKADEFLAQNPQLDRTKALSIDPGLLRGKTLIRFVHEGDRIRLKDGAKQVLRLLQDMHVPSHLRARVPVLVDEDGLCAVFCQVYGGKDRICVKLRTSLAPKQFPLYIVHKG